MPETNRKTAVEMVNEAKERIENPVDGQVAAYLENRRHRREYRAIFADLRH